MNESLKNTLLGPHQVRKTRAQKHAFQKYVREYCEERGLPCRVEVCKGLFNSENIIIGDPDTADMIFTAHYDTCAVLPFPNFITPLNIPVYLLYQLAVTVLLLLPPVLVRLLLQDADPDLASFLMGALTLLDCEMLMFGPANRHTANDNTSGVAAVLESAAAIPEESRGRVAFVLFDNEEIGLLGSGAFFKKHRSAVEKKPLVNFDCVSDGENMLMASPKIIDVLPCGGRIREVFEAAAREHGKTPVAAVPGKCMYPSDQKYFPFGMAVAALKKSRRGLLYMDRIHTNRDTRFDETNIDMLADMAARLSECAEIGPAEQKPKQAPEFWKGVLALILVALGVLVGLRLGMRLVGR